MAGEVALSPDLCGHCVSGPVAQDSVGLGEQPVLKNHPRTTEGFLGASHPSLCFTCFQTDHLRTISKSDNNHPAAATAQSRAEIRSQATSKESQTPPAPGNSVTFTLLCLKQRAL